MNLSKLGTAAVSCCIAVLAACTPLEGTMVDVEPQLRVMSFNIRNSAAQDGANGWTRRREMVVDRIRAFSPDVVGLQEVLVDQAAYLDGALTEYTRFGRGRERDPMIGEQAAVLFLTERFEQLDAGHFWLSETPTVAGSKSWDASLPRIVTWVRLRDRQDRFAPFHFHSTHFDHRGDIARARSAALILERVPRTRAIIAGDFNTIPDHQPHPLLIATFVDTYRAVHPGPEDNRSANGFGMWSGGARIDWVLASPDLAVLDADIDHTRPDNRYPSDHDPVRAILDPRSSE